ncbi:hypothetical protein Ddye_027012 [Dipteronia dyeriana]|uniref:RNase H type-1 domain-containing protein n=1 Tax=Dipteronia dyeriana TaxID=168575 RepID=A0AAD9TNA2_9ROSI|nr:hypothetical protein Ddye_027012 [Dipteronia dyeriana]
MATELAMVIDMVRFRVAWWFKHHGRGFTEPITVLVENLEIFCFDEKPMKAVKSKEMWMSSQLSYLPFTKHAYCVLLMICLGGPFCIKSDSKMAVSWVNEGDFGNLALVKVIYVIRSKISCLGNLSACFAPRDANAAADVLAKRGLAMEEEIVFFF